MPVDAGVIGVDFGNFSKRNSGGLSVKFGNLNRSQNSEIAFRVFDIANPVVVCGGWALSSESGTLINSK